jgi:GNAT superfamily N-acetyltransferase
MKADDFEAVVGIDEKVLNTTRPEYYEMKFEKLFETKDYLPASLVAEKDDGTVVGFVMGETYMGEFGIFQDEASLDTIGVDPDYQHQGIGEQLMNEFMDHMRKLGVRKINTLVDWDLSDGKKEYWNASSKSPCPSLKKGGRISPSGAFAMNWGIRPHLSIFSSPFVKGDRGIFHCCMLYCSGSTPLARL